MKGEQRHPTAKSSAATFTGAHALVVAVAGYRCAPPLPQAVLNDGQDVADVLTSPAHCGFDPTNVCRLVEEEATATRIKAELRRIARAADEDSSVVIYFSGHGARFGPAQAAALLPIDYNPNDLTATTLVEPEITAALKAIRAGRLVVILDACHSGGAGNLKALSTLNFGGFTEKSLFALASGKGRVVIASSRVDETSNILPEMRNSLFTTHLLDALKGYCRTRGDGLIRVFEVFDYVAQKVRAHKLNQTPIFKADAVEENFPIALDRGGTKSVGAPSSTVPTPAAETWSLMQALMPDLYPLGPTDQAIWSRAGGDLSQLKLGSTGNAEWHVALRTLRQGGGGREISVYSLIQTALQDYPHHSDLVALRGAI